MPRPHLPLCLFGRFSQDNFRFILPDTIGSGPGTGSRRLAICVKDSLIRSFTRGVGVLVQWVVGRVVRAQIGVRGQSLEFTFSSILFVLDVLVV